MTDPDLLAVRQLAAEPTDESVTRSWYRITQLEAIRSRPSRMRRLTPVIAALSVVLLAAASVTVVRVGPGTLWPVASTPETIDVLNALADTAEHGPAAPQLTEGQLIRVKSEGWAGGCGNTSCTIEAQPREMWFDPQGMIVLKILAGTQNLMEGPKANAAEDIAQQRQQFQQQQAGLNMPTPQWLAGLPTDSGALLTLLREQTADNDSWTVDHQLWDAMGQLYSSSELLLPPAVRAALLRSFRGLSGLSVRHVTIDGAQLVAIRQTDGDSGNEIIFDPQTGRAVGRGSSYTGDDITIVQAPNGPVLDPGILYQATWEQSIVDGL
ncbi:hypothetical protein Rhe02_78990 [Rhizocola hellebori]|uniref:CU044_5270 family protein n=1 Tax=Rhizocola hellebori TaxID=1392758 RepID=A0A8J3QHQ6_9ACTN|nr:CU044_5270 family protein [Rhizocola hellebori]GIH09832.1 hypothetical protein Rhe02_78990 [Rhizocola hellebori]